MKTATIDGIYVTASEELSEEELHAYVTDLREHYLLAKSMRFELDGEYVNVEVHSKNRPFERIRRISGYLVGSLDKWNDAKRAEEADRVKHDLD